MEPGGRFRQLLVADLALSMGIAPPAEIAAALDRFCETGDGILAALDLDGAGRALLEAELTQAMEAAGGDAEVALARRGGLDRTLFRNVRPRTSADLLRSGAPARAPLRKVAPDRYQDFEVVGKGGMGVVYLALDTELNRRVAFKMVVPDPRAAKETPAPDTPLVATPPTVEDPESGRSFEEFRVRFLQEAWVTGAMEHPGVVPVYELGETEGGIPYYTMRYVKGERTLAQAIRGAKDIDDRLALLEPFLKICDTIGYAHSRGVIHRDLKPENIALGEFGETVVLDWGLSKMKGRPDVSASEWQKRIEQFRDATDLRTVAGALGTPGYMAPEAALGHSAEVDERSDIYSLGAILFEILTRRLPFTFKNFVEYATTVIRDDPPRAHEVDPGVPRELSRICAQALAREKEGRTGSVAELATDLRHWQTEGTLERQVHALLESTRDELEVAPNLSGNVLLWHLDRALANCNRVLHLRPDEAEAHRLQAEIKRLRERGIRERVRGDRRSLLQKMGVVALAAAAVATLVVANMLESKRADEESTRLAAQARIREVRHEAQGRVDRMKAALEAARYREQLRVIEMADRYAELSGRFLEGAQGARARVVAAKALSVAATPATWRAMAEADARWAPSLQLLLRGVRPTAIAFGPLGEIYWTGNDLLLREVKLATGATLRTLRGLPAPATVLRLTDDGGRLLAGTERGHLVTWDRASGNVVSTIPEKGADLGTAELAVTAIAGSPDGRRAYVGHRDGVIRVWDIDRGALVRVLAEHKAPVSAIFIGEDRLYSGDAAGTSYAWDKDGFFARDTYGWVASPIAGFDVSDDRESLFTWNRDGQLRVWSIADYEDSIVFDPGVADGRAVFLGPGRKRMCTVLAGGALRCWDPVEGKLLGAWGGFGKGDGPAAADGTRVALATPEPALRVWDLTMDFSVAEVPVAVTRGGQVFRALPDHRIEGAPEAGGHTATITALATDAASEGLISAALDGSVLIRQGSRSQRVTGFGDPVTAVAFAGGTHFLAGTLAGDVQIWDWEARGRIATLATGNEVPVCGAAAGGGYVYAASMDGSIVCWSESGEAVADPLGDQGTVTVLAASPEGTTVAYAAGHEVRRWDPGEGKARKVKVLPGDEPLLLWWEDGEIRWCGRKGRLMRWDREGIREGETLFDEIDRVGRPWVARPAADRLMEAEERFGLMIDAFEVVPVPPEIYKDRRTRTGPWSK